MASWTEIRKAATAFSKRWRNAFDEKSQAQSFLKEFFAVFGVDAVTVATFEHRVKFADGSQGYADCLWPGRILVEMKSRGKDLDAAFAQAMEYVRSLRNVANVKMLPIAKSNSQLNPDGQLETGNIGTGNNGKWQQSAAALPRAIVVSDFARVRFYDLANDCALTEFALKDLRKYVTLFGFMIGAEENGEIREQDPVNRRAAEKMARLHDAMKAVGYTGHPLEVYLVRLLFCLFAEDTGIFKPEQFSQFVARATAADGHDLAPQLALIFDTLNRAQRLANLDEAVAAFPYVNGGLFAEPLPMAAFSAEMRKALLDCSRLDWSKISPAIFGAMFQGVMDEKARHDIGAHYTSEENILKLIRPLFLDALRAEFNAIAGRDVSTQRRRGAETAENFNVENSASSASPRLCVKKTSTDIARRSALMVFHAKIASLTFLDPACGCGNFLLIAYRELRRLEMDVLEELYKDDPGQFLDISQLCKVSVSQFYGIEIEPFAAEIAKVALWLMDHLCNMEVADRFGQYFARIPIKDAPHIVCANALRVDWKSILNAECRMQNAECGGGDHSAFCIQHSAFSYIFGNPPFLGASSEGMDAEKKADMRALFPNNKNLDFVCGWYKKASDLIQGTDTRCAFVSTNSITQGEQVAPLWKNLNVEIDFAYRTFKWHNEAKGVAAVHCVIIGFHAGVPAGGKHGENGGGETRSSYKECPQGKLQNNLRVSVSPQNSVLSAAGKIIFDSGGTAHEATHINGYLVDGPDVIVESRNQALCDVPQMVYGNKPTDGGNLILTPGEKDALLAAEPQVAPFIRPLIGAEEFLHGTTRHCIWLVDADPALLGKCPMVKARIEAVRKFRLASKKAATRRKADYPMLFDEVRQPKTGNFIVVPRVTSERRKYVPMGFMSFDTIVTDLIQMIPDATLYHFGILSSRMHMAWMRAVAGRLKSDYRYSKDIVYNNFIWPGEMCDCGNVELCDNEILKLGGNPIIPQSHNSIISQSHNMISSAAQMVLDARAAHPTATLADLYDPLTMPPDLVKAHAALDALVDKAYNIKPSATDDERVALLFKLYVQKVAEANRNGAGARHRN